MRSFYILQVYTACQLVTFTPHTKSKEITYKSNKNSSLFFQYFARSHLLRIQAKRECKCSNFKGYSQKYFTNFGFVFQGKVTLTQRQNKNVHICMDVCDLRFCSLVDFEFVKTRDVLYENLNMMSFIFIFEEQPEG